MAKMPNYYKLHTDGCTVALEPIYTELVPVVHGRWVGDSFCKWQCDKCHAPAPKYGYPTSEFIRSPYCPNCGAHMKDGD